MEDGCELIRARPVRARSALTVPPPEIDVFPNVQVRKQPAILIKKPNAPRFGRTIADLAVINPDSTRCSMKTGDCLEQHRLAGPAGPEQHHIVASVDAEFIHAQLKLSDAAAQPFNAQHRWLPSVL